MKIRKKKYFVSGIIILIFLILSYFIKFNIDSGANYEVYSSLLSIIILENPFILGLYILAGVVFIFLGISDKKHR